MAADSGRLREAVLPRTREAGGTHRIQVIAWRRGLLTGLRHGDHAHRYFRGIYAWQDHLLSTLLSRDPAHRHSSAISPWRSSLLAGFWHGDLAHKYLSAILAWQDCLEPVQNRSLADSRPIFGTAPPPTGTPEPSPRGEAVIYRFIRP